MNPHRPEPEESPEGDPTGMRALLSSLPDPGPMPDELVARISASLQSERESGLSARPATVSTLSPRRRRVWRTAGLAAAAAAVVGIGLATLNQTSNGDLSALIRGTSSTSSSAEPASAARSQALTDSAKTPSIPGTGGRESAGAVTVRHTETAYTTAGLPRQARSLLANAGHPLDEGAFVAPDIGPIGTPVGIRSCAEGLGLDPHFPIIADLGTFDSQPATILVVQQGEHPTAYAVLRDCSVNQPSIIAGPTPLAP